MDSDTFKLVSVCQYSMWMLIYGEKKKQQQQKAIKERCDLQNGLHNNKIEISLRNGISSASEFQTN